MPRPTCREDGYEYRVKRIFAELHKEYAEDAGHMEKPPSFEEWVWKNHESVANAFLADVESYMGIPEADE